MKYLIHGATNGSNFGDCLFAHFFYRYLLDKPSCEVDFFRVIRFGLCKYLANELNITQKNFGILKADALVYMSGGYFGDTNGDYKEAIIRYFRYFWVADLFRLMKKDIYICGVGGGPVRNKWLLNKNVSIMNYAKSVTVRDVETADYYKANGVKREIIVTTDTALSKKMFEMLPASEKFQAKLDKHSNKKIIFLHIYGSDIYNEPIVRNIVPALNRFCSEHPGQYAVAVGTDNKIRGRIEDLDAYKRIETEKFPVVYTSTSDMCAFLGQIDCAVTAKLHVGIVSARYGKSVLSFPLHKFKTRRFYAQIGESDRCCQLSETNADEIYKMLDKYVEVPICIPDEMSTKALLNLSLID